MTSSNGEIEPLVGKIAPTKNAAKSRSNTLNIDTCDTANDASNGKHKKRRLFSLTWAKWLRFSMPSKQRLQAFVTPGRRMDAWCGLIHSCVEKFVYLLGPILIIVALSIIGLLVYTYFTIIKVMLRLHYADKWYGSYVIHCHTCAVIFLLVNVTVNYFLCVMTNNIKGKSYDKVMREMASATGFIFPETPAQVEHFRQDYEDRMVLRMQCRRQRAIEAANRSAAAATTSNNAMDSSDARQRKHATTNNSAGNGANNGIGPAAEPPMRPWMMMGPLEWGFCNRTYQPKPPRAHYCHVSKGLVFCLDHYCPWMFTVGYFNYRYFVNFLMFACISMLYAASLSYTPFLQLSTPRYREQFRLIKHHKQITSSQELLPRLAPFLPYPHEKIYVTLTFMLSLAVGMAVMMLCAFHIYLVLTSQTTIEFHGNYTNKRRAKRMGKKWKNPYDFGTLRNFQQVYGSQYHPLLAFLIPSAREPEFLPIPIPGDQGKRATYAPSKLVDGGKSANADFLV